jgi:hypothetical protein
MEFEKQILSKSTLKEANLLKHALKAAKEPDTGITINVKSAYNVIRDCATIASNYLAIHAYVNLPNPIRSLSSAFTKAMIKDFVKRSQTEKHTHALLTLILIDIKLEHTHNPVATDHLDDRVDDDVYGDYDCISETKTANKQSIEDNLCVAFNATK